MFTTCELSARPVALTLPSGEADRATPAALPAVGGRVVANRADVAGRAGELCPDDDGFAGGVERDGRPA